MLILHHLFCMFSKRSKSVLNVFFLTETKDQWARDDPAFLVLLSIWLCGKLTEVIGLSFLHWS